jgi:hypothetical protein
MECRPLGTAETHSAEAHYDGQNGPAVIGLLERITGVLRGVDSG